MNPVVRRTLILILLVSVVALSAIGWFMGRGAVPAESRRLGLTLLVNQQPHVEMSPGTPLIFELSLGSSSSAPAFDVGSRWRPWYTLARIENVDASVFPSAMTSAGHRSVHFVRQADGRQDVSVDQTAIARLEAGRHVHTLTLAAAPEETSRISPGTYHVRAVLETPFWLRWGWRGRAVSLPVTIVVRAQGPGVASDLEVQRTARTADYYIRFSRFAEAHAAAAELVTLTPRDATAHIILGDALAGLNRRPEALESYQRAIVLLPRSIEEPTLLTRRISSLLNLDRLRAR